MKIIKGICGFIIFLCLVAIAIPPMMFEVETIDMRTAIIATGFIALTAVVAFIGYIVSERLGSRKIDFSGFIHQEYLERQSNKKRP